MPRLAELVGCRGSSIVCARSYVLSAKSLVVSSWLAVPTNHTLGGTIAVPSSRSSVDASADDYPSAQVAGDSASWGSRVLTTDQHRTARCTTGSSRPAPMKRRSDQVGHCAAYSSDQGRFIGTSCRTRCSTRGVLTITPSGLHGDDVGVSAERLANALGRLVFPVPLIPEEGEGGSSWSRPKQRIVLRSS